MVVIWIFIIFNFMESPITSSAGISIAFILVHKQQMGPSVKVLGIKL